MVIAYLGNPVLPFIKAPKHHESVNGNDVAYIQFIRCFHGFGCGVAPGVGPGAGCGVEYTLQLNGTAVN
jgi:hypothetical protein